MRLSLLADTKFVDTLCHASQSEIIDSRERVLSSRESYRVGIVCQIDQTFFAKHKCTDRRDDKSRQQ